MTRHLGASILLSVAFVLVFSAILYQPEGPPTPSSPANATAPVTRADPDPRQSIAEHAPGVEPAPASRPVARGQPVRFTHPSTPRVERDRAEAPSSSERDGSVVQTVAPRRSSSGTRSGFTEVLRGETLADVAARVYGSAEAAGRLWAANRDILGRPDGPLGPGTLLRTP